MCRCILDQVYERLKAAGESTKEATLPHNFVAEFMQQLAAGLADLHALGIVHNE